MRNISSRKLNAGLVALAAFSSVLVTGCSSEGIVDAPEKEGVPFQVKATIGNASSKAATNLNEAGNFESGDQIWVYSHNASSGADIAKDLYTFDGTSWNCATTYYVPSGYAGPVIGIYPADEVLFSSSGFLSGSSTITTTVQLDQSGDEAYRKSDLMVATGGVNYDNPTCKLEFTHQLCKIVIDLSEALAGLPATNAQVSLMNVKPGVSANVNPNGITSMEATGTTGEITLKATTQTATTVACIIPPQDITTNTKFFKVVVDGVTYTGTLNEATTFTGNTVYTYKITIRSTQFIVTQATISDWATQNESVDITVENE